MIVDVTPRGQQSYLDRIQRNSTRRAQVNGRRTIASQPRLEAEAELLQELWQELSQWRADQSVANTLDQHALEAAAARSLEPLEMRNRLSRIGLTPEQLVPRVIDWLTGYGYVDTCRREVSDLQDLHIDPSGNAYFRAGSVAGYSDLPPVHPEMMAWLVGQVTKGAKPPISILTPLPPTNHIKDRPGVRVRAVHESVSDGYALSIRFMPEHIFTIDELVQRDMLTSAMAEWLVTLYLAGANMLICGATGAGKSTLAYALTELIEDDRMIIIGNPLEIRHSNRRVVALEVREAGPEGGGQGVDVNDFVVAAMTMAPDRLVLTEARGREMLPLLNGLMTGHEGSLTTIHADSIRQAFSERAPLMIAQSDAGRSMSPQHVARLLAGAFDVAVHVQRSRNPDGTALRTVSELALVHQADLDTNQVTMKTVFRLDRSGTMRCEGLSEYPESLLRKAERNDIDLEPYRLRPATDASDAGSLLWNTTPSSS